MTRTLSLARSPLAALVVLAVLSVGAAILLWVSVLNLDNPEGVIPGLVAMTIALAAAIVLAVLAFWRPTEALSRSVRTFRAFADASPSAKVILTADHRIAAWNPSASRIFNPSLTEAVGRRLEDVLEPQFADSARAAVDQVLRELRPYPVSTTLDTNGHARSVQGSLFPIEMGDGARGVGAVLWDTTEVNERRRAAEDLQTFLDAIINSANEGIVSTDGRGSIVTFNWGAERLFRISPPAAIGRQIEDMVTLDDGASIFDLVSDEPRAGVRGTGVCADGAEFVLRGSVARLDFEGDRMLVFVLRDASVSTARQHALRQARQEAERANAAKTEFLSRISHELRTPLNVILGFAQVMQLDGSLGEKHGQSLTHITRAGRHLVDLIDDVLDISGIEAGRLSFSVEPVSLREAAEGVADLMQPVASEHDVTLHLADIPASLHVHADRNRLRQVLINLVSNAIKYNVAGGTVTLSAITGRDRVVLVVEDTGRGIPADRLDRVFEPFDRLGAEATNIAGTGLGLALSRALVEGMGGVISVESEIGTGSVFRVDLPAASPVAHEPVDGQTATDGNSHMAVRTVLYIEDNVANLNLVERIFELAGGARVIPAMQGSVGVELARVQQPDLILLDLHLPDMTGEDVLRRLGSRAETRSIPVVVSSADASPGRVARLMEMGAYAYLTKPLNIQEFLSTVDEAMDGRAPGGPL